MTSALSARRERPAESHSTRLISMPTSWRSFRGLPAFVFGSGRMDSRFRGNPCGLHRDCWPFQVGTGSLSIDFKTNIPVRTSSRIYGWPYPESPVSDTLDSAGVSWTASPGRAIGTQRAPAAVFIPEWRTTLVAHDRQTVRRHRLSPISNRETLGLDAAGVDARPDLARRRGFPRPRLRGAEKGRGRRPGARRSHRGVRCAG